jgi:hypothetical protein
VTFAPLPVATGNYPALGHAADYTWIAGEVEKDLTCTYLRFGSAQKTSWGGRIALVMTAQQLSQLQSGDTIVVTGTLVAFADGSCGSPSYVVSTIQEH